MFTRCTTYKGTHVLWYHGTFATVPDGTAWRSGCAEDDRYLDCIKDDLDRFKVRLTIIVGVASLRPNFSSYHEGILAIFQPIIWRLSD
jgi:hypothetical protein